MSEDKRHKFPVGNKFWLARAKHGKDKIFATPLDLWSACLEYFEWNEENPLFEARLVSYLGQSTLESIPKMRALTIQGLCVFLGVDSKTWAHYRDYEGYGAVCKAVEDIIYTQKFSGAAAGLLNPLVIMRDLGLADKKELAGTKGGEPIRMETLDKEHYAKVRAKMLEDDDC